jgi:hypothetical protein
MFYKQKYAFLKPIRLPKSYRFSIYSIAFITISLSLSNCRLNLTKTHNEIALSGVHKVQFLDSVTATKQIIRDDLEKFFERLTVVDAMIQMKKNTPLSISRDSAVADYKRFLQTDVADFSNEEKAFVEKAMTEAFQLCLKAAGRYFPEVIGLVKSHGKAYGEDAFYTRENLIVIPKQALDRRDYPTFLRVMLHEISHIITRTNPSLKAELYALIGFKKVQNPLLIPDSLRHRLLTNPDGIDLGWSTNLTLADGKSVFALPLLYARANHWLSGSPEFFQNMGWNYFEILPSTDAQSLVVQTIGNRQQSTLNTEGINALFKANFNTDYIIHPDEIIADNFALLVLSEKEPQSLTALTEGGRLLITKMRLKL